MASIILELPRNIKLTFSIVQPKHFLSCDLSDVKGFGEVFLGALFGDTNNRKYTERDMWVFRVGMPS